MSDPSIGLSDDYSPKSYGMEVPERLFWEWMVTRQDIHREPNSENDTGRPSEPNFQTMNNISLRKTPTDGGPKTVILWYIDPNEKNVDSMNPLNLVMAYEENGRVMPVVLASRQQAASWTSRWLKVLKTEAAIGFYPKVPPLGFSDPKTHGIMKHAIHRLRKEGSVRHGTECFDFHFPQELDDQFLVISDNLSGTSLPWKYVDPSGLQEILKEKIDEGYTCPINPKWVLCDTGWKDVYDKLMASDKANVQESLRMWYPPESGIRDRTEEIHHRHKNGFVRISCIKTEVDGTGAMDLAEQELRYHLSFQRAKRKLRGILIWRNSHLETHTGRKQTA